MKVLIIGSGGREHAIAFSLSKSKKVTEIHAIPGNPGISKIGTCHNGSVEDLDFILQFVKEHEIDLTVIGPEVPLCLGLADLLEDNGFKVFGPRKYAATLEGSKAFSKNFMEKHNIEINDTNWNAIAKRYRRKRDLYHTYERIKKYKKKSGKSLILYYIIIIDIAG